MTNSNNTTNSGKTIGALVLGGVAVLALGAAALYLVDVDQTKEARLPTVSMDVEKGQVPEFDVDVADIKLERTEVGVEVPTMDVETKTIEIEVPVDADVGMEEKNVSVPALSIEKPEEDNPADR